MAKILQHDKHLEKGLAEMTQRQVPKHKFSRWSSSHFWDTFCQLRVSGPCETSWKRWRAPVFHKPGKNWGLITYVSSRFDKFDKNGHSATASSQFEWDPRYTKDFEELKPSIAVPAPLEYFDPVDRRSAVALGAVLVQFRDQQQRIIAFASTRKRRSCSLAREAIQSTRQVRYRQYRPLLIQRENKLTRKYEVFKENWNQNYTRNILVTD